MTENPNLYLWIIPLLPLTGAAINGFFGKRFSRQAVAGVALTFCGAAFAWALWIVAQFSSLHFPYSQTLATWIRSGSFSVDFAFYLAQLSLVMLLLVTGVGFLIHIYSVGYMWEEGGYYRFFSYLNLFMFFMLTLVLASNYLLMFVGWEGVGLASYLLIGFWFTKDSAAAAGKKAFIVNRIGDFGFLIALFLIIQHFGSLDFQQVFAAAKPFAAETSGAGFLTAIALLLMVGAAGKSAQIPLYVWLPDAMEGPTPVSALIHAATMVTAGVYMVARSHLIFENAPDIHDLVALIGVATLLMAGAIAVVQTDIKRIIAYSTMSTIGYMFAAVGVGAYSSGMDHLLTHAFFKALLFLGAGIVIHALSGEQDVRRMGGLHSALPRTTGLMWIGTIALIGFWPTSKDGILAADYEKGGTLAMIVWVGGLIGVFFTGVYGARLMRLTFYGPKSTYADVHLHDTSHGEAPRTMFWTVAALAAGTILSGFLAIGFGTRDELASWLRFVAPTIESSVGDEVLTTAIAWGVGLAGAVLVWWLYARPERLAAFKRPLSGGAAVAENLFYWDA